MPDETKGEQVLTRRELLRRGARGVVFVGLGGMLWRPLSRAGREDTVWQIDPEKCVQCGRCATECVLSPSAVKCVHAFDICGYCDLCFAYFRPATMEFDTGAEKQLCPTFAITRTFIEHPYYEYTFDETRCIGCAKCVKGCETFGNGSLYLQVRRDRCLNCNRCSIAAACPAGAFVRVPADRPYLLKGDEGGKASRP